MTTTLDNLKAEIKQAIVRSFRLPITPAEIGDSTALFCEDLCLDSIDLLDRRGVHATFFVVGWVAERLPELVDMVRAAGHEVGSHSYLHQKAYDLGPERFRSDLRESLRVLLQICGGSVTMFRAPEWSINDRSLWALDALAAEGVRIDASMAPLRLVGDVGYPRYPHIRKTQA